MFVYPNEHHIKWQPAHRLAVYERDIDRFAFWFQNVVDPDPAKAAEYDRWKEMRARPAVSSSAPASAPAPCLAPGVRISERAETDIPDPPSETHQSERRCPRRGGEPTGRTSR